MPPSRASAACFGPCARREGAPLTRTAKPIASIPKKRRRQAKKTELPLPQTEPTWPPSASAAGMQRRASERGKPPEAKLSPKRPRSPRHRSFHPDRRTVLLTWHALPEPLLFAYQDITTLARLPNHPRRLLLDPHPPLRYADRRNGANPP